MYPQSCIQHYRITAKLGEGGMGEVWRATDTKLERDVALKYLSASFAQDPERLGRREARVVASVNHPNIVAIYGVEGDQNGGSHEQDAPRAMFVGGSAAGAVPEGSCAHFDANPQLGG